MAKTSPQQRQIAALPLRTNAAGRLEVMLITSRETRRWVIPKGWPMSDRADHKAAATEAFEEAGLTGKIGSKPLGAYLYWKRRQAHFDLVEVAVYRLDVTGQLDTWPEKDQRTAQWFDLDDAVEELQEPGLKAILLQIGETKHAA